MDKKTTTFEKPSFYQSIDIAAQWCKDWEQELLSDEVLADRVAELVKTKNGLRGFFAYALSDINCSLLDKLPSSLIFKFAEAGEQIVEITFRGSFGNCWCCFGELLEVFWVCIEYRLAVHTSVSHQLFIRILV